MKKKQVWYSDSTWKIKLFHGVLTPFYYAFKVIFKRSLIMIVCPHADENKKAEINYRDTYDFVRLRTLGFLAEEAGKKLGDSEYAVAEVGVFRGGFASYIERLFPGRQLYLFDTFGGFPAQDKNLDIEMGLSKQAYENGDFDSTSVELVLGKMSNPDNCHICKGYFPETVTEEHKSKKWGFVSLDVDLYKPMLDGLRFFYPALLPGGAIMIHDYNNSAFSGVKKAVDEFEKEVGVLAKVPIPDSAGSLVIVKPEHA